MHNSDYYREEAAKYRQLAEGTNDAAAKKEFLELAEACETAADKIDDCRASGRARPAQSVILKPFTTSIV